jgi:hypothetical protein
MNEISMPEEENITLNEFYQLFTIKPELFQGKDLVQLKSQLDQQQGDIDQIANTIIDWCKQYNIDIAEKLAEVRRDVDEITPAPPSPVASNEIIDNIFMLVNQKTKEEYPPEVPADQPENQ